ncbi:MAG: FtsW/RodA/SpoVE family cell cycle protein [Clostridiaceae bacterium]|nr:FtsW/RodA/SpoVE family cell cycle protein [Clostridiaceae bacterium]
MINKRWLNRYKLDFRLIKDIDKALLISMILIMIYGMLNIYLCTKGGIENYGPYFFIKKQAGAFIVSMIALYFLVAIDYRVIFRYVPVIYWGSVALLVAVWIPGIGVKVNGARGWIRLGIMNMQPAEVAKFAIILMFAKILDDIDCQIYSFKNIVKMAFYVGLPVLLIIIQPDMGMGMVCFFIVLGMLYIAGLDRRIIGGGFLALLIAVVVLWNSGIILPHQKSRIISFMSPETDDSSSGYQLNQGLIGIGSGGIFGTGPSLSANSSLSYGGTHVPEIQTDFIFAATAENWGLIGAILLLIMYGVLISRMLAVARNTKDRMASLMCIGLISYFLFAITQNIGMVIGLLPITGITLPLMSYGGSSLLTTTMALSLVLNVGMRKKSIRF